ncbi:MAG: ABC transporter substrate-binding protein [Treponema sp.]|nr:ABC transporter substrate-binding protein [Treponema sp.]
MNDSQKRLAKEFLQKTLKTLRLIYLSSGARLRQAGHFLTRFFQKKGPAKGPVPAQTGYGPMDPPARRFPKILLKIALDNVLWLWALVIAAVIIIFKLTSGGIPGMASRIDFGTWWGDHLDEETIDRLIVDFEEKTPGISIDLKKLSSEEMLEHLAGEEKKGGANGIISLDPFWLPALETNALLTPLNTLTGEDDPHALSVISFINPLYYNVNLLREAGFDRPPKTQDEFLSYVQSIHSPERGIFGAALALRAGDNESVSREILSWIWNTAGIPLNDENTTYADYRFNSKEALPAFEFLEKLRPFLYPDPFTLSVQQKIEAFKAGKIGMIIASSAELKNLNPADFGVTTIPVSKDYYGKSVFSLSSWYVGLSAQTNRQEEAETFIRYLRDQAGVITRAAYAVPGNGRRIADMVKTDPNYVKTFDMYDAGEMVHNRPPITADFNSAVRTAIGRMYAFSHTPAEAAEAVQSAWEEAIK